MRGLWTAAEIWARYPDARLRLIRAREDVGMSRPELAERLGVSRFFVLSVETGHRQTRLALMAKWAKILNCPLEFFLPPTKSPVELAPEPAAEPELELAPEEPELAPVETAA